MHHAAIDAVAGAEILTAIHTHEPDGAPPPPAEGWSWEPDPVPSDAELLRRAAVNGLARPLGLLRTFRRVLPQIPALAADRKNPDVTSPASLPKATRFNQKVGPHRVFGTSYTSLDVLKEIRTGMPEAKINDIGLAVVGGAIRAYLLEKDELPDESLIAMMPISIRPTKTRKQPRSVTPSRRRRRPPGNQFSIAPITMATDEADPLDRLARIVGVDVARQGVGSAPRQSAHGDVRGGPGRPDGHGPAHRDADPQPAGPDPGGPHPGEQRPGPASRRCTSAERRWSTPRASVRCSTAWG